MAGYRYFYGSHALYFRTFVCLRLSRTIYSLFQIAMVRFDLKSGNGLVELGDVRFGRSGGIIPLIQRPCGTYPLYESRVDGGLDRRLYAARQIKGIDTQTGDFPTCFEKRDGSDLSDDYRPDYFYPRRLFDYRTDFCYSRRGTIICQFDYFLRSRIQPFHAAFYVLYIHRAPRGNFSGYQLWNHRSENQNGRKIIWKI